MTGTIMNLARAAAVDALRLFRPLFGAALMLSVTRACQGRCARCAVRHGKTPGGPELADSEIEKLIDEAAQLGAREVHFFGGEPLLRGGLPSFISRAHKHAMRTTLTTNGLLAAEPLVSSLAASGLTAAAVSLDDPAPEVHDAERGLPGLWEQAVAAIAFFRKHGVAADISFCATSERLRDGRAARMCALAARLGARLRILSPMRAGSWDDNGAAVLSEEDRKILRGLLSPGKAHWVIAPVDRPGTPFVCTSLNRWKVDVTASGEVVPCTYFPVPFGNIRRERLGAIVKRMWSSPLYREFSGAQDCPLNDPAFRGRWEQLFKELQEPT